MYTSNLAAAAALVATASAQTYQGFNYGASFTTGAAKQTSDFQAEFTTAQNLVGHKGFTSARLYTMIQGGTTNTPISAIQAAINTKTSLLLGLWASAGQASMDNEIAALNSAIKQYGTAFTDLIAGISVGSEDLYRITPTGIQNKAGVGEGPAAITSYIKQVRGNLTSSGTKAQIGHVDTWTAWVNGSNSEVVQNCDWLGVDSYPFFQTVDANGIENGAELFFEAYDNTTAAAQGKPVWITETGWPVSGAPSAQAVASVENAKRYWDDVACKVLGTTNTWWYTLQDAEPTTPDPSFGLVAGPQLSTTPLFDLSCSNTSHSSNSTGSGMGSGTSTGSGSGSPTGSGSGSTGSGSGSGSTGSSSGPSSNSGSTGSGSSTGSSGSTGSGSSSTGSSGSTGSGSTGSGSSTGSSGSTGSGSTGSGSSTGSSGSTGSGSSTGSSGSTGSGSTGSGSSPSSSGAPGSYGSTGSGSSSSGAAGSSSSSPYSSSNGAYGSGSSTSSGSSYTTPRPGVQSPAAYTGGASANKPATAIVAGLMGLAALLA